MTEGSVGDYAVPALLNHGLYVHVHRGHDLLKLASSACRLCKVDCPPYNGEWCLVLNAIEVPRELENAKGRAMKLPRTRYVVPAKYVYNIVPFSEIERSVGPSMITLKRGQQQEKDRRLVAVSTDAPRSQHAMSLKAIEAILRRVTEPVIDDLRLGEQA